MSKNPLINALGASTYIVLVVSIMSFMGRVEHRPNGQFIIPVAILSMFTLSAAVMAYIFGYHPVQLYFENKKKLAIQLFLKTVVMFAALTALIFIILLSGVLS